MRGGGFLLPLLEFIHRADLIVCCTYTANLSPRPDIYTQLHASIYRLDLGQTIPKFWYLGHSVAKEPDRMFTSNLGN